uniref:Peptidase A1 domain-containing protein n=1 Tax=Oryza nivara TaxID=4536 RepID=A0A0E0GNS9_ORYNI
MVILEQPQLLLLLLLLVAAAAATGATAADDELECPSSIFDHAVNSQGAIQFPVFHKKHQCLRPWSVRATQASSTGASGAGKGGGLNNLQEEEITSSSSTKIDVIEDSSINDFLFLMAVSLGKPPVVNLVAIDTGSTLSWVQCQPCAVHCHTQSAKAGPIFDPGRSYTSRRVRCSSVKCGELRYDLRLQQANCMEKEDSCTYSVTYGNGWAYSVGKMVTDTLRIGDSFMDLMFGCSMDVKYSEFEAGIFGFGSSSFSFFEQLAGYPDILSYKAFSYCLPTDETKPGYMILGRYDRAAMDGGYTPLFRSINRPTYSLTMEMLIANGQRLVTSSSEMIVDSGAQRTSLWPSTFALLDKTITQAMSSIGYHRTSRARQESYICYLSEHDYSGWNGTITPFSNWSALPLLEIGFAGGAALALPPRNVFYTANPALRSQILGNRVTRSFGTTFDIQGKQFGFKYAAC